jgi:hypothetical protein
MDPLSASDGNVQLPDGCEYHRGRSLLWLPSRSCCLAGIRSSESKTEMAVIQKQVVMNEHVRFLLSLSL